MFEGGVSGVDGPHDGIHGPDGIPGGGALGLAVGYAQLTFYGATPTAATAGPEAERTRSARKADVTSTPAPIPTASAPAWLRPWAGCAGRGCSA